jgi:hypothetical protein
MAVCLLSRRASIYELLGPLAAHPLRGLSEPVGGDHVANKSATSQIALPKAACDEVYALSGYESSATNLSRVTLAPDNVFSDGSALELATVSGSTSRGMTSSLTVAV